MSDSALATAHAFFRAYESHDVEAMLRLCTDDAQLRHVPMGPLETGLVRTVGRKAWSDIFAALPDLRVTVTTVVSDDRHIATETLLSDSNRGFELPQAYFLTVDETYRITTITAYWDNVSLGFELTKAGAERFADVIWHLGRR